MGEVRHGVQSGPPDVRLLGGYFVFVSPDAALLVSLLPQLIHIRGETRLATLVQLVGEESREQRSGRESFCRASLMFSSSRHFVPRPARPRRRASCGASPMLDLRGQFGRCIKTRHERGRWSSWRGKLPCCAQLSLRGLRVRWACHPWSTCSRWRMALAKALLRRNDCGVAEVAERVGYSSASTFSTAFSRRVGQPPARYARSQ